MQESSISFVNDILKPDSGEPWIVLYGQRSVQYLNFGYNEFSQRMLQYGSKIAVNHAVISPTSSSVFTASVYEYSEDEFVMRISKHAPEISQAEAIYQLDIFKDQKPFKNDMYLRLGLYEKSSSEEILYLA